jgi:hypothetical protein
MRSLVDVLPERAAAHAHGMRLGVHLHAVEQRQVDDQRVVPDAEAAGVVAPATNGDRNLAIEAGLHARDNVGHVRAFRDRARPLVDHRVVDLACLVVSRVAGLDQLAS